MTTKRKVGKYAVQVVTPDSVEDVTISAEDLDMDKRVRSAVNSAIKKARVCKKPIAKYDLRKKKAYVEIDGVKKYVD